MERVVSFILSILRHWRASIVISNESTTTTNQSKSIVTLNRAWREGGYGVGKCAWENRKGRKPFNVGHFKCKFDWQCLGDHKLDYKWRHLKLKLSDSHEKNYPWWRRWLSQEN